MDVGRSKVLEGPSKFPRKGRWNKWITLRTLGHGSIGYHSYHRETFVRHKNSPWLITRSANDPNLTYLIASVNRLSRSGQDYRSIRLGLVSFKSSPTIQNAVEKKASVGRRSIY